MTGNVQIDNIVKLLSSAFGIDVPEADAARWADELETGSGRGRDYETLRADIFKHWVTDEKVDEYVATQFADRDLPPAEGQVDRVSSELQTGERTFAELGKTLDSLAAKYSGGGASGSVPSGMRLLQVADTFYGVESIYGVEMAYLIGSEEDLEAMGGRALFASFSTMTQAQYTGSDILGTGTIDERLGATETLQAEFDRDLRSFGLEAPPEWMASDKQAFTVFVTGAREGWSPERTWQALSSTSAFKTRFSGIDTIMRQADTVSYVEAIAEYTSREDTIRDALRRHRGPDADVSTEYVSGLIAAGWTGDEVADWIELEADVKANPAAFQNFKDLMAFNGRDVTPDDFVSFLRDAKYQDDADYVPSELFEIANDALRQTALERAGLEVSDELASSLGRGISYSIESSDAFDDEAQYVAGVVAANRRGIDLGKYGLDEESVVKHFLGDSDDPDVGRKLERLGRERGIAAQGFAGSSSYIDAEGRLRMQGVADL